MKPSWTEVAALAILLGFALVMAHGWPIAVDHFFFAETKITDWLTALATSVSAGAAVGIAYYVERSRRSEKKAAARFHLLASRAKMTSIRMDSLVLIVDTESLREDVGTWPFEESQNTINSLIDKVRELITPEVVQSYPDAGQTLVEICDELASAGQQLNETNLKQFTHAMSRAETLMKRFSEISLS